MLVFASLLVICAQPAPSSAEVLNSAQKVTFEYWQRTESNKLLTWDITFDKKEIQSIADLLAKAELHEGKCGGFWVGLFKGMLTTDQGTYRILIGKLKLQNHPTLITLIPLKDGVEEWNRRTCYKLPEPQAEPFWKVFEDTLKKRATEMEPTKVESR